MLKKLSSFIFETLQVIIFAVSIFLFVYLLVLQPHKIKGQSMSPSFKDGEFLLTDKVSYRFGEAMRGDVVVFEAPGTEQDFIKRIIGLPGETVLVKDGRVFIDNKELAEPYLEPNARTNPSRFTRENVPVTVPPESIFVLGDNRDNSLDSRSFGFISVDKLRGKAWFVYWPPELIGLIKEPVYAF